MKSAYSYLQNKLTKYILTFDYAAAVSVELLQAEESLGCCLHIISTQGQKCAGAFSVAGAQRVKENHQGELKHTTTAKVSRHIALGSCVSLFAP